MTSLADSKATRITDPKRSPPDGPGATLDGIHLIRYGQYRGAGGVSVHLEALNRQLVKSHSVTIHQFHLTREVISSVATQKFERGTIRIWPLTVPPRPNPSGSADSLCTGPPETGRIRRAVRRLAIYATLGDNAATDLLRKLVGALRSAPFLPETVGLSARLPFVGAGAMQMMQLRDLFAARLDQVLDSCEAQRTVFVTHLPAEIESLLFIHEAHRRGLPVGAVHHTGRDVHRALRFTRTRRLATRMGGVTIRGLDDLLGPGAVELGNGIDVEFFDPARAGSRGTFRARHPEIPADSLVVLVPGSVKRRKRQHDVLAAVRLLRDRTGVPHFTVVFVGADADPGYRRLLDRRVAGHNLRDRVLFVGHLPQEELRAAYRDADIGVLASEFEGQPRVVLEMGAMGIPVVVTDADGSRETLSPDVSGLLVEVGRPLQLADAVGALLMDEERRKNLGEAGRRLVCAEHSLAQLAHRHAGFYLDILWNPR